MLGILRGSKRRKRRSKASSVDNVVKVQTLKNLFSPAKVRLEPIKHNIDLIKKVKRVERNTINHFKKNINSNVKVNFKQLVKALPKVVQTNQICKDRKERRREIFKKTKGKGMRVKKTNWNLYSYIRCK